MNRRIITLSLIALLALYISYAWSHSILPWYAYADTFPRGNFLVGRMLFVEHHDHLLDDILEREFLLKRNIIYNPFLDWQVFAEDDRVLPVEVDDLGRSWDTCAVRITDTYMRAGCGRRGRFALKLLRGGL